MENSKFKILIEKYKIHIYIVFKLFRYSLSLILPVLPYRFCEQKILKYNTNDKYKGKKIIRLQNFRGEKFELMLKIYFQFPNFCSSERNDCRTIIIE